MICKPDDASECFLRAGRIKALVMDVDGVLTEGRISYDEHSVELKSFNAKDGFGIKMARTAGLITALISGRESRSIRRRAAELKIDHLFLGRYDKRNALEELCRAAQITPAEVCYIGDDLPDQPVMEAVGLGIAVADAAAGLPERSHLQTETPGGRGAVREVIEFLLFAQGRLASVKAAAVASH